MRVSLPAMVEWTTGSSTSTVLRNWGHPGSDFNYNDDGFAGGVLVGKKFQISGVPFRIELDGTFGDMSATTNTLDPEGLDETAKAEFRWSVTTRAGVEHAVGPATVFATGGLAIARVANSVHRH